MSGAGVVHYQYLHRPRSVSTALDPRGSSHTPIAPRSSKTELLVVSANLSLHHNFTFQLVLSTLTPSKTAKHLGVVINDTLNFSDYIVQIAQSYRFVLYNMKIRPFLSEHATQLLVQALVLSRLDYCNALLAGLPNNSINPLQLCSCGSVVRALC